ncbi:MAG TPA: hypothetical protein VGE85_10500 [Terracidiphilus sp.]
MKFKDRFAGNMLNPEQDSELNDALTDFRLSVHAWSDAAFSRSRTVVAALPPRRIWRLAVGCALGCVLVTGGASVGLWQHHQREIELRITQARIAEHQRLAAQQQAQQLEDEDLLAKVDSDVSREVPIAMEPLAQLMVDDETP